MAVAVGRIGHQEKLSLVGHLDELRSRLIVCLAVLTVSFGVCIWQSQRLLKIVNAPLAHQTQRQVEAGKGPLGATYELQQATRTVAAQLEAVVGALERPRSGASSATRGSLAHVASTLGVVNSRLSRPPQGDKPVTLGVGEPFTTTLGVSLIFALILSLPVLLYQMYGFFLPALSPEHQRAARPLVLAIPVLFSVGVIFGYYIVLPAAVRFLQNYNSDQFNVLVQASQYYHFAALILLAMGLVFQVPVGVLAAVRARVVRTEQLRRNRRYAVIACGAVAALLPGDAVTLLLETLPLYLLFELSLALARIVEHRERRARRATAAGDIRR